MTSSSGFLNQSECRNDSQVESTDATNVTTTNSHKRDEIPRDKNFVTSHDNVGQNDVTRSTITEKLRQTDDPDDDEDETDDSDSLENLMVGNLKVSRERRDRLHSEKQDVRHISMSSDGR